MIRSFPKVGLAEGSLVIVRLSCRGAAMYHMCIWMFPAFPGLDVTHIARDSITDYD